MMRTALLLYGLLLSLSTTAQDMLGDLRDPGTGFARVTPGGSLQFPRDHGAHPDYRIEWWYLTANLTDGEGRHWGLQWTQFRQALSPRPASGWQSNQMWMAHAALTTPEGHVHAQRFARGGIGQAGVSDIERDGYFNAWMDDWEWRSGGASLLPAKLRFTVEDRVVVLLLEATGDLVENGAGGYSRKSAQGQASYYYSHPHIRVRGFVSRGPDKTYLSGQGWLDREWSSQALADNQQGWDWFSLHLDDGHKLMVYRLRHEGGNHWLSGNWIGPGGASELLDREAIDLRPTALREVSTGENRSRRLPMEWRLALVDRQRRWRIRPLYDGQWMDTRFPYWEGVVLVEDENGARSGIGYMELTGYD